jgi:hypothetical protein
MAKCWETRPCDEEMQADCPHPTVMHDRCPAACAFAHCVRPTRKVTSDPALVFDGTIDRSSAIRAECLHCEFFLTHAPRIDEKDAG